MDGRRKKGSGSLRSIGGGKWRYQCRHEGTLLSRVFEARNQTEAEKATAAIRVDLIAEYEARRDAAGAEREVRQSWTVERYADYYLAKWASVHLASTTRRRYKGIIETNVKPAIGKMRMGDVTPTSLQAMYAELAGKGARQRGGEGALSGPTIWTVHSVMRALFTFAVEIERDFATNPAASRAARPNVPRTGESKRAVTVEEVEGFVALARERVPHIAVPVALAAWLGTRRSETLALQWRDVDWDAEEVSIRRSVTETPEDGVIVKETTKTNKVRRVPLDASTVQMLRALRTEQRRQRVSFGAGWRGGSSPEQDWVCALPDGSMVEPEYFANTFRAFTERERVSHITPHLLRHAYVSQMIALGYDAVTISSITGHSPEVLLRTYAHAYDERKREAVTRLGEARTRARSAIG